jgi:hypothetical protein
MSSVQKQDFQILNAIITADRKDVPDEGIDIKNIIIETTLFSDIEKPYVSGKIMILDDNGLFDKIRFSGTERLDLEIGIQDESYNINRTFIMTSIEQVSKSNESLKASVYLFNIVDEYVFIDKTTKFSKSFEGTLDQSIANIITNYLGVDVYSRGSRESAQTQLKYIVPYMTPFEACEWLRRRVTTDTGLPFFVYARLYGQPRINISPLDELYNKSKSPMNDYDYQYNPTLLNTGNTALEPYAIKSMQTSNLQTTYTQLSTGSIGSEIRNTNLNTGVTSQSKFDLSKYLEELDDDFLDIEKQNIYDTEFRFSVGKRLNESLHENSSRIYHTLSSEGTYDTFKSYGEETDSNKYITKLKNTAMRNALYKNMIDIVVQGSTINEKQIDVGDVISVLTLSDDTKQPKEHKYDELRSGLFLVYNIRHTYAETEHSVAMTLCKLRRGDKEGN